MNINFQQLQMKEYFEPIKSNLDFSLFDEGVHFEKEARIEDHPFFKTAKNSREAMILWTCQELIVTNPFSQILFRLMSNIKNVHIRSILMPVVSGEHSEVEQGIADKSHPWLIWKLCQSLGIKVDEITPTNAVKTFIQTLENSVENPIYCLGMMGIGNEYMLMSEYRAVEDCFDAVFPKAEYKEFLHSNIGEDRVHSKLMGEAAVALVSQGGESKDFLEGARDGVRARVAYYDSLLTGIIKQK